MTAVIEAPERRGISAQNDSAPERLAEVEGVLDIEKYQGLYGRLYIAGESPTERMSHILNPDPSDPVIADDLINAENNLPERVNFNHIASKLSISERRNAWKGVEFDDALKSWVEKRIDSARNATNEKRILVLEKIYGKSASEITEHDVYRLYYESGGEEESDIDGFINRVENAFSTEGTVDARTIKEHITEIETVAAGFFGKNTARVIARGVELKTEIRNNPQRVLDEVVHANGRLNNLNPFEADILTSLHDSFSDIQASYEPDPNTAPAREPDSPTEVQEHLILEVDDETHGSFKAYPEVSEPEEEINEPEERVPYVSKKDRLIQEAIKVDISPESNSPWEEVNQSLVKSPDKPVRLMFAIPTFQEIIVANALTHPQGIGELHLDPDPEKKRFYVKVEANTSGVSGETSLHRLSVIQMKRKGLVGKIGAYGNGTPIDGFEAKLKKAVKSNLSDENSSRIINSIHVEENGKISVMIV